MTEPGLHRRAANEAVACATNVGIDGVLIWNHEYMLASYNPVSDTFLLLNPWGNNEPPPLSFAQLEYEAGYYTIGDASGSLPFDSGDSSTSDAAYGGVAGDDRGVPCRSR